MLLRQGDLKCPLHRSGRRYQPLQGGRLQCGRKSEAGVSSTRLVTAGVESGLRAAAEQSSSEGGGGAATQVAKAQECQS